jgi:TatD DNase family protein
MVFYPRESDFIDIHSHHTEREEGVFRIQNVFTSDFQDIPADRPISIGLHPWHLSAESIQELPGILNKVLSNINVLALGEAGLDRVIKVSLEDQFPAFRKQIEFSIEYGKPLIIHCVKAIPELIKLRKEYTNATGWIVHGFNGNETLAAECVEAGICISLSQRLFRNPEKALKIAKQVPLSMAFAETDDDSMSIREVYETISQFYEMSVSEVISRFYLNYRNIFR